MPDIFIAHKGVGKYNNNVAQYIFCDIIFPKKTTLKAFN
jgi:hypothetical protein